MDEISADNYTKACYYGAYRDLHEMNGNSKDDIELCRKNADLAYERFKQDFRVFEKARKQIIGKIKSFLGVCSTNSDACARTRIPIKELYLLRSHHYQYDANNVDEMDKILRSFRDCNNLAIQSVYALTMDYTETLDDMCDFVK